MVPHATRRGRGGGAAAGSALLEEAVGPWRPAQEGAGFGKVVHLLRFVPGDKDGVEAPASRLHRLQRQAVGLGQVLFIGDEDALADRRAGGIGTGMAARLEPLLARPRAGDA